ncbi:methyltransferase family protein [Actinotalea solisilvae]|uniref:methyltransferase family protein n=1 Tax=Actinotalea solisilvae TaxID=2072922 RepID=UPI0027DBB3B8|nr:isoprenylcysteine carboxylmethyltransferase family protein [Actinotalea solisilvae]
MTMTGELSAVVALVLDVLGLVVIFGVRSWAHRRTTGSAGFRGLSGRPWSAPWWGGVLFAAALVLTTIGVVLAVTRTVPAAAPVGAGWVGLALAVAGFVGVAVAQSGMGTSWRIGVDAKERTTLVTGGLFSAVRNPIFTAMCAALAGLVVMVPNALTVIGLVALVVAIELQVRVVEEPYLLAAHGEDYAAYATRVGRFVPGVGLLQATSVPKR